MTDLETRSSEAGPHAELWDEVHAWLEQHWDPDLSVDDLDLVVEHLRLLATLLRPRRRLVPGLALDVDVHAARGVPQLCPMRRFEVAQLEAEEAFVEVGDWPGVGAVDRDADPSNGGGAHVGSLLEAETENRRYEAAAALTSARGSLWPWRPPSPPRSKPAARKRRGSHGTVTASACASCSTPPATRSASSSAASRRQHSQRLLPVCGMWRPHELDEGARPGLEGYPDRPVEITSGRSSNARSAHRTMWAQNAGWQGTQAIMSR